MSSVDHEDADIDSSLDAAGEAPDSAQATTLYAERPFQLLVESVKDYAIFMLDRSGRIATWNAGAQLIKGYSPEEAMGKHLSIFYTPEDLERKKPEHLLAAALRDGRVEDEGFRVRKDGSRFWADVVITALRDAGGQLQGFVKVTRDLTARKKAEEALQQSEESLRATLYGIGDAVLATDEKGRVTRINPVAERLTGWSEAEAFGHHVSEVFSIMNEETRQTAQNPVDRVLAEGIVVGLANHTALTARDGTVRPIADSGAPILDALGTPRGAVLVFRDVTEERRAQEERLRLTQAQEAIRLRDEFLSIASHELKTPLTALQLQLQLLREAASPGDQALAKKLERALRIGVRLSTLIEDLLDVSRIATGRLKLRYEAFDLEEAVREVLDRLRESAHQARCELHSTVSGPIPGRWDRLRIEQVVTNLLSNSIKYGAGYPITVTARREGDSAVLEVRDRGPGIPETELSRIFERFERASPTRHYGGLGLGLYVAREIVQAHAGVIQAVNAAEGGACLTVRLPLVPR